MTVSTRFVRLGTSKNLLKERGIALLSLEEKLDTSSAAGELVFHVFGAIAQFERRLIAERTKTESPQPAHGANCQAANRSMPTGSVRH